MSDASSTIDTGIGVVVGTLELDIATGSDSLRLDSDATATIRYHDGTSETLNLPMYDDAPDGGTMLNYTQSSLSKIILEIHSAAPIAGIDIALVSHPIPDLETNDSWTISNVRAVVTPAGGQSTCVLDRPGKTITDGVPLSLAAGACANAGLLRVVVVTGSDDLRSDSTATVTVAYEGASSDVVPLTKFFSANSTVTVDLNRTSTQPVASLTFAMQSHPNDFESNDNWDIAQVEALESDGDGGAAMCFINALGKTIGDGTTLTVTPGGCPAPADAGADDAATTDADTKAGDAGTD